MYSLGIDIGGTRVKAACLRDGQLHWTRASARYDRPNFDALIAAIRQAIGDDIPSSPRVGLCVPGIMDASRECITYASNVPGLNNVPLRALVDRAMGTAGSKLVIANDSNATAFDLYQTRKPVGRLLVIAMGGGIGCAVLDDGMPLYVDGDSAGHIGQLDISLPGPTLIAPDGGAGGLEAYLGGAALRARYGADPASKIAPGDDAFLALVRIIRICLAFYRPHHVCLAGGFGIRLGHLLDPLRESINTHLTSVARADWTLSCGDSDFHAASGAARLAMT